MNDNAIALALDELSGRATAALAITDAVEEAVAKLRMGQRVYELAATTSALPLVASGQAWREGLAIRWADALDLGGACRIANQSLEALRNALLPSVALAKVGSFSALTLDSDTDLTLLCEATLTFDGASWMLPDAAGFSWIARLDNACDSDFVTLQRISPAGVALRLPAGRWRWFFHKAFTTFSPMALGAIESHHQSACAGVYPTLHATTTKWAPSGTHYSTPINREEEATQFVCWAL